MHSDDYPEEITIVLRPLEEYPSSEISDEKSVEDYLEGKPSPEESLAIRPVSVHIEEKYSLEI